MPFYTSINLRCLIGKGRGAWETVKLATDPDQQIKSDHKNINNYYFLRSLINASFGYRVGRVRRRFYSVKLP